jgi:hypothetical protein
MCAAGGPRIAFVLAIKVGHVERVSVSAISTVQQNEEAETSPA